MIRWLLARAPASRREPPQGWRKRYRQCPLGRVGWRGVGAERQLALRRAGRRSRDRGRVRGFADRAKLQMHNGQDILHQNDPARSDGGYLLPWRVDTSKVDGQDLGDTPHDWNTTHLAWNNGLWNQWPPFKSELTMAYFGARRISRSNAPSPRPLPSATNYLCSIQRHHGTFGFGTPTLADGVFTRQRCCHKPRSVIIYTLVEHVRH